MSNRGRPRHDNAALELSGSRNAKHGQIESGDIYQPNNPPDYLSLEARHHWAIIVPELARMGTAKEADRTLLAMLCSQLAKFHDTSINVETKEANVPEIERRNICKNIVELSDRFGMNPLARSRSGVSSKVSGIKQRPK